MEVVLLSLPLLVGGFTLIGLPLWLTARRRRTPWNATVTVVAGLIFSTYFVLSAQRADQAAPGSSSSPLGEAPGWLLAATLAGRAALATGPHRARHDK